MKAVPPGRDLAIALQLGLTPALVLIERVERTIFDSGDRGPRVPPFI